MPMVWDIQKNCVVNNESLEILRNWNTGWNSILEGTWKERDFYPEPLRFKIDEIGAWIQSDLNTGVYKVGWATDQEKYDKAVPVVFRALNRLENIIYENGGTVCFRKGIDGIGY